MINVKDQESNLRDSREGLSRKAHVVIDVLVSKFVHNRITTFSKKKKLKINSDPS